MNAEEKSLCFWFNRYLIFLGIMRNSDQPAIRVIYDMLRILVLQLIATAVLATQAFAQNSEPVGLIENIFESDTEFSQGSKLAISRPDLTQIENLAVLAKVWGFRKYHHPRIVGGEVHWDYELLRLLRPVFAAASTPERN